MKSTIPPKTKPVKITASQRYLMELLGTLDLPPAILLIAQQHRSAPTLRFEAFECILRDLVHAPHSSFEDAMDASPLMPLPLKEPKGCWGELRYAFKTEVHKGQQLRVHAMTPSDESLAWTALLKRFKVSNDTQKRWVRPYHDALRRYCQENGITH
jgi:hypothetical protein